MKTVVEMPITYEGEFCGSKKEGLCPQYMVKRYGTLWSCRLFQDGDEHLEDTGTRLLRCRACKEKTSC